MNAIDSVRDILTRNMRQSGIVIAFLAIVVLFAALNPNFLSPTNLTNIVLQYSYILILAIGMVMIIVAGQIDLSVGSVVALTGGRERRRRHPPGHALVRGRARRPGRRPPGRRLAGLLGRVRRDPPASS